MILPSIFLVATVVGGGTFLFLLIASLKQKNTRPAEVQDLLALAVEALLYTGFVTSGLADIYFGVTGGLYPGLGQSEFGPQITVTGLALIVAAPIYIYQRLRPSKKPLRKSMFGKLKRTKLQQKKKAIDSV